MDHFNLQGGVVHCEDVPLPEIADAVGTPVYVYSSATLLRHVEVLTAALSRLEDPLIAYAVKANPNAAILATLSARGLGADVVSGGEYARARVAGIPGEKIVFSGVGKTEAEMKAALEGGVFQFNLESESEAEMLSRVAVDLGVRACAGYRVNPDVEAGTHAKISTGMAENKFGIPIGEALEAYRHAAQMPGLVLRGVAVHIGSQLTSLAPLETAFGKVGRLIDTLRAAGQTIEVADLGGGLGVPYDPDLPAPPSPQDYGDMVHRIASGWGVRLVFEPGRLIVGNAGILLTRVIRVKPGLFNPFVVVDAAMNDLMRPALYDAWHKIDAVHPNGERMTGNVVGPVCETGDTFAMAREMDKVEAGDLVCFRTAGAYAAAMSSTYNSRPLTAEVLVNGSEFAVVRQRVSVEDLIALDRVPDWLSA